MLTMLSLLGLRFQPAAVRRVRRKPQRLFVECLEQRQLLAALPYGAQQDDTGEFLLGDVYVTVVAFESNGSQDANTENWNDTYRNQVKSNVESGLQWWVDTLGEITDKHALRFEIDYTHLDTPVPTGFEPISRSSSDFQLWIYDFLNRVGYNQTRNFSTDIRAFNHAQRLANETHWAFTIFVVNDQNDPDGRFAPGSFDRAFAYAGGRFFITPAGRPSSTYAHETGHMFWARDEYAGGGTYNSYRGYYNTQNWNAADNPVFAGGVPREPSIMDRGACEEGGGLLCTAYLNNTSSKASLEMMGWRDSDADGVFDLLDVPHTLTGLGSYDPATQTYRFQGESRVQTFPNRNTSGLQNDITIATISRVEYRVNEGAWQTAATYGTYSAAIDLSIPLAPGSVIDFRSIDDVTGVTSSLFRGTTTQPSLSLVPGIQGLLWQDDDRDGAVDTSESRLAGWTVQLVDANGSPLQLQSQLEPDRYSSTSTLLNQVVPDVTLSTVGSAVTDNSVFAITVSGLGTNERVFGSFSAACGGFCSDWTASSRTLRVDFAEPVMRVELDAIGRGTRSRGRLDAYDSLGNLLTRYTTQALTAGVAETMTVERERSDIAYVIARAHDDSTVHLDRLGIGTASSTTSRSDGSFAFGYLPPGEYHVAAAATSGFGPTQPTPARRSVTLAAGQVLDGVNFGFAVALPTHQNPRNRFDVNNDGFVSPQDALSVINFLNARGSRNVEGIEAPPYRDVNADNAITPIDALQLINYLNSLLAGESEGLSTALDENQEREGTSNKVDQAFSGVEKTASWSALSAGSRSRAERPSRASERAELTQTAEFPASPSHFESRLFAAPADHGPRQDRRDRVAFRPVDQRRLATDQDPTSILPDTELGEPSWLEILAHDPLRRARG